MSDVRLIYFDWIPDQEIDRACSDLRDVGLECESFKTRPPGPWNSVEWFVPTAIVLIIAKPYLQSFLGEMGKDHYSLLKKGVAKLWRHFFSKDTTVPDVTLMSKGGILKSEYTHTFSVVAETNDGRMIKLLLPADIGEDDFALHFDVFIDFLCRHYAGDEGAAVPSCFCVKEIDDQIFVTLAENRQNVRFLDPLPRDIRNDMVNNQLNPANGYRNKGEQGNASH